MRMSTAFPSKWLRAADLQGHEVTVQIDRVVMEDVSGDNTEEKPVIYFRDKKKGLVLNKTNAGVISMAYGDETDEWEGKPVVLFPSTTQFQGRMVECLRVRVPVAAATDEELPPF